MAGLLLRDEKTREAWRIWPDPQVVPAGRVQETGSYLFELHDAPDATDQPTIAFVTILVRR